jgi:hypothetical protein
MSLPMSLTLALTLALSLSMTLCMPLPSPQRRILRLQDAIDPDRRFARQFMCQFPVRENLRQAKAEPCIRRIHAAGVLDFLQVLAGEGAGIAMQGAGFSLAERARPVFPGLLQVRNARLQRYQ